MANIDRVRYYDGEFLRAFDFSDEQTYHMEMRRRLNRYLHLDGIVQGLQLLDDVQSVVHSVSFLPGVAIDSLGREIYVFAPYTFGDTDIAVNRISKVTNYDVWLHYKKSAATPPSSGYGACNQPNEFTRWAESYSVVLLESPSTPVPDPGFADDDTDNPDQDGVAVLLGTVFVDRNSATQQFSIQNPGPDPRVKFTGVIAQRIQAPLPYDATQALPPFVFRNKNTPLSPPLSLEILPNVFADQNLVVGPDFDLTKTPAGTTIQINPDPTSVVGSAKLAGDLFVQGKLYNFLPDAVKPQWLELSQYIKQLLPQFIPDVVATSTPVTVMVPAPTVTGTLTTQATIPLSTSKLATVKSVVATASIAGIQHQPGADVSSVSLFITNVSVPAPSNNFNVTVTYSISPIPASLKSPIISFALTVTAVCFPT